MEVSAFAAGAFAGLTFDTNIKTVSENVSMNVSASAQDPLYTLPVTTIRSEQGVDFPVVQNVNIVKNETPTLPTSGLGVVHSETLGASTFPIPITQGPIPITNSVDTALYSVPVTHLKYGGTYYPVMQSFVQHSENSDSSLAQDSARVVKAEPGDPDIVQTKLTTNLPQDVTVSEWPEGPMSVTNSVETALYSVPVTHLKYGGTYYPVIQNVVEHSETSKSVDAQDGARVVKTEGGNVDVVKTKLSTNLPSVVVNASRYEDRAGNAVPIVQHVAVFSNTNYRDWETTNYR